MTIYTATYEDYTVVTFKSIKGLYTWVAGCEGSTNEVYDEGDTRVTLAYLTRQMKAGQVVRCCQQGSNDWYMRLDSHKPRA